MEFTRTFESVVESLIFGLKQRSIEFEKRVGDERSAREFKDLRLIFYDVLQSESDQAKILESRLRNDLQTQISLAQERIWVVDSTREKIDHWLYGILEQAEVLANPDTQAWQLNDKYYFGRVAGAERSYALDCRALFSGIPILENSIKPKQSSFSLTGSSDLRPDPTTANVYTADHLLVRRTDARPMRLFIVDNVGYLYIRLPDDNHGEKEKVYLRMNDPAVETYHVFSMAIELFNDLWEDSFELDYPSSQWTFGNSKPWLTNP